MTTRLFLLLFILTYNTPTFAQDCRCSTWNFFYFSGSEETMLNPTIIKQSNITGLSCFVTGDASNIRYKEKDLYYDSDGYLIKSVRFDWRGEDTVEYKRDSRTQNILVSTNYTYQYNEDDLLVKSSWDNQPYNRSYIYTYIYIRFSK